ncbi:uncharacterized protein H6S33_000916 [Morchella sextelata]|uniref:uncharacterized protein n=1 Tax=Morchella sextelata TaxID=1174677 RepID=UPI001D03C9F5|nr:uncharacterized protein H6S33_000916 [Morchella sextelata]KAH0615280.1 hypothetical protein H6S33_000916 [Morchella sextelata]
MASNTLSLSNNTKNTQILHYTYLLLHKNGTVLPLVSAADLPSTITVLPPTGPGIISLLQEISHPRSAPEVLETTPAPAVAFTPQNPSGLVQYQGQGREIQSSGCEKSATTPAGSECTRDDAEMQSRAAPSSYSSFSSASSAEEYSKKGPFYTHPHSHEESSSQQHIILQEEDEEDDERHKARPCAYFQRRIGCRRGKNCFYIHAPPTEKVHKDTRDGSTSVPGRATDTSSTESTPERERDTRMRRSIGGKWRREEGEEVVAEKEEGSEEECNNEVRDKKDSPTPSQHIKTHCTFFLRFGECDYWPTCKFSHERPEGSWRSSSRKLATTLPQRRSGSNSISGSELYEEKPREVRVGKLISY